MKKIIRKKATENKISSNKHGGIGASLAAASIMYISIEEKQRNDSSIEENGLLSKRQQ